MVEGLVEFGGPTYSIHDLRGVPPKVIRDLHTAITIHNNLTKIPTKTQTWQKSILVQLCCKWGEAGNLCKRSLEGVDSQSSCVSTWENGFSLQLSSQIMRPPCPAVLIITHYCKCPLYQPITFIITPQSSDTSRIHILIQVELLIIFVLWFMSYSTQVTTPSTHTMQH